MELGPLALRWYLGWSRTAEGPVVVLADNFYVPRPMKKAGTAHP